MRGRQDVVLYLAAIAAGLVVGSRGPVYWDGFGYVAQSLGNYVGGLALGRPLFVIVSHQFSSLFLALGVSAWGIEPWLRGAWLCVSASTAPLVFALARRARLSRRASWIAGLIAALSPAVAHASAAVMTDVPSTALTLSSLLLCARAVGRGSSMVSVLAGVCFGAAVGLREQAFFAVPCLLLLLTRARKHQAIGLWMSCVVGFLVMVIAPVAWCAHVQVGYVDRPLFWLRAMVFERHAYPYGPRNLMAYAMWLLLLGPVVIPAVITVSITHTRRWMSPGSVAFAVIAPLVLQLIAMAFFHDIALGPRFLVPSFVGSLALVAARRIDHWLDDWKRPRERAKYGALIAGLVLPLLVGSMVVHQLERPLRTMVDGLPERLSSLPDNVVIVTGQGCPALEMIEQMARIDPSPLHRPSARFPRVCAGWSWPAVLADMLDESRRDGAVIVVDLREGAWSGARQSTAHDEAIAYVAQHDQDERDGALIVWR